MEQNIYTKNQFSKGQDKNKKKHSKIKAYQHLQKKCHFKLSGKK